MRNKCYNPRRAYVSAIFNPQQCNVTSATSVTKVYKSLHFAWHTLSDAWHTLLILASLTPSNVKVFYGFCGIRAYRMAYAPRLRAIRRYTNTFSYVGTPSARTWGGYTPRTIRRGGVVRYPLPHTHASLLRRFHDVPMRLSARYGSSPVRRLRRLTLTVLYVNICA